MTAYEKLDPVRSRLCLEHWLQDDLAPAETAGIHQTRVPPLQPTQGDECLLVAVPERRTHVSSALVIVRTGIDRDHPRVCGKECPSTLTERRRCLKYARHPPIIADALSGDQ
jgi:hypothetical protein